MASSLLKLAALHRLSKPAILIRSSTRRTFNFSSRFEKYTPDISLSEVLINPTTGGIFGCTVGSRIIESVVTTKHSYEDANRYSNELLIEDTYLRCCI